MAGTELRQAVGVMKDKCRGGYVLFFKREMMHYLVLCEHKGQNQNASSDQWWKETQYMYSSTVLSVFWYLYF